VKEKDNSYVFARERFGAKSPRDSRGSLRVRKNKKLETLIEGDKNGPIKGER